MPDTVWSSHARQWSLLGPPLRPSPEDVVAVERVASEVGATRLLLLGVTPEIATCALPPGADLTAVDVSEAMIAGVWPRSRVGASARALCADWREMPFPDGAMDFAVGDGVFTVVPYPEGARSLARELGRVLCPRGHLVVRAFVPPGARETPEAVVRDLLDGRIRSFHAFKWRLVMAGMPGGSASVKLADVWDAWHGLVADPHAAMRALGWDERLLATIEPYRDARTVYAFPSVEELVDLARDVFDLVAEHVPGYELGERCPTLVFRRKG